MTDRQTAANKKMRPSSLICLLALCALGTWAGMHGYSSTASACSEFRAYTLHTIAPLFAAFCTGTALLAVVRSFLGEVRTFMLRMKGVKR